MLFRRSVAVLKRASDRPSRPVRAARDRSLEQAIAAGAIRIAFQPQIDPTTGRTVGVEALARWNGVRSADELFARARAAHLHERLSRAIQRIALRQAAAWGGAMADLRLSINVLPDDLARAGYAEWLVGECIAAGFPPRRLTIEIVESAACAVESGLIDCLATLRAHGVRVAIDDFGAGYANLAWLAALPIDAVKIDRGLIVDLAARGRGRIVVQAMIALARDLGLDVVVEGVETAAQLALVSGWGIDAYQGFLGSPALAEDDLSRFVALA